MKSQLISKVILELTLEEASWLNSYMQNPLHAQEDTADNIMRRNFFDATSFNSVDTSYIFESEEETNYAY